MNTQFHAIKLGRLAIFLAIWPLFAIAQVPVDDAGSPIGDYALADEFESYVPADDAELELASIVELESLIGPIALYPDDLLAIILPASTYPLQLVEASRFLEDLEQDPSLQPDEDWDDSVVALSNYPEVIKLLNDDLDWTWQLGEAVVAQQADVISAVESFRDRAYAAGNLKTDEFQNVSDEDGVIEITPVNDDVIYVPYYEPESVVVYQPQPVYYYHPRPRPVYYYPYPYGHSFNNGFFWGVTTAFTIGWATDYLHVRHHSYVGHPYYGYHYNTNWWYRRPSISVHNTYYVNNNYRRSDNYYQSGDQWRSNNRRRLSAEQQVTRSRHHSNNGSQRVQRTTAGSFAESSDSRNSSRKTSNRNARSTTDRSTSGRSTAARNSTSVARKTVRSDSAVIKRQSSSGSDIKFRDRGTRTAKLRANRTGATATRVTTPTRPTQTARNSNSSRKRSSDAPPNRERSSTSRNTPRPRTTVARNNESQATTRRDTSASRTRPKSRSRTAGNVATTTRASSGSTRSAANSRRSTASPKPAQRTESKAPSRPQRQAASRTTKPRAKSASTSSGSGNKTSKSGSQQRSSSGKKGRAQRD